MNKPFKSGRFPLLALALAACLSPKLAFSGEEIFNFSGYNTGIARGCVIDAETKRPVSGASVSIQMGAVTNQDMLKPVSTDDKGCYQLQLPVGTAKSEVKAKKVLKSSLFSLVTNPKGVTEKTKIIYNNSAGIKVEKTGYKSFTGVNKALFGDPKPFEIYLDGVMLAPENVEYASHLSTDGAGSAFTIEKMNLPGYFRENVEYQAEVSIKAPAGLAPEFIVKINYSDPAGKIYEGDKYTSILEKKSGGESGTLVYAGKVVAQAKRFPKEFRIIAAVASGENQLAQKWLPVVLAQNENEEAAARHFAEGIRLYEEGDSAASEEALGAAVRTDKQFKYFYEYLGDVLAAQGKLDEALGLYREWLVADPKNHNPNIQSAKIYVTKRLYETALEELSKVSKLDKKDGYVAQAYFEPLKALHEIEKGTPAAVDFEKALDMLITLAGDYDYSFKLLEKAESLFPNDAAISFLYGNALYGAGKIDEAVLKYERAVNFDSKNGEYIATLASVYFERKECPKVLNLCEPRARDSNLFPIHYYAGVCGLADGNPERAKLHLIDSVKYAFSKEFMNKKDKYVSGALYDEDFHSMGTLVFYQGQTKKYYSGFSYDEAERAFDYLVAQNSLQAKPGEAVSLLQSGIALHEMGLHELAVDRLNSALASDGSLAQAYKRLYLSHRQLGNVEEEKAARENYLTMNPFDVEIAGKDEK